MNTQHERASFAELTQLLRNARFGCLAPGCEEVRDTYTEIDEHMNTMHPELS